MKLNLVLHPYYDKDLVVLSESPYLNFQKFVRDALSAYAKGMPYHISPQSFVYEDDLDELFEKKTDTEEGDTVTPTEYIRFQFSFSDKRYPELVSLLSHVRNRQLNLFTKTVLRNAVISDTAYIFLDTNAPQVTHYDGAAHNPMHRGALSSTIKKEKVDMHRAVVNPFPAIQSSPEKKTIVAVPDPEPVPQRFTEPMQTPPEPVPIATHTDPEPPETQSIPMESAIQNDFPVGDGDSNPNDSVDLADIFNGLANQSF